MNLTCKAFSVFLISLCTGCCMTSGQYKRIEGIVDPKMEIATLPIHLIKTRSQFNVHTLQCGDVENNEEPRKLLGVVNIPLAFCRDAPNQSYKMARGTFSFEINGIQEEFKGFCSLKYRSDNLVEQYFVLLRSPW